MPPLARALLACVGIVLGAGPAAWAAEPLPAPKIKAYERFDVDHAARAYGVGVLAAAVAGGAGMGFGLVASSPCSPGRLESACRMAVTAPLTGLSAAFGAASGVWRYGAERGFTGSLGWTLFGSLSGAAVAGAVAGATWDEGEGPWLGLALVMTLPSAGATLAYAISANGAAPPKPARGASTGALLELGPDGAVRLRVPAVSALAPGDPTAWHVPLIGGAL